MPLRKVRAPDGSVIDVDAPDNATPDQVIALAKAKQKGGATAPPPAAQEDEPFFDAGDVARSSGRGLALGTIGLAGLPGDINEIEGNVGSAIGDWLGISPETQGKIGTGVRAVTSAINPAMAIAPTSAQIRGAVESKAGKFGKPKSDVGRYAQSITTMAPTALLGPGGWGTRALTTVTGGLGAQAGEDIDQALGGSGKVGQFVGGLAGGTAGGYVGAERAGQRLINQTLPSHAQILADSRASYDAIANSRLRVTPQAQGALDSMNTLALDDALIVRQVAPRTFAAMDQLARSHNRGADISDLMGLSQRLGAIKPDASNGTDFFAADIVRSNIDDFISQLQPHQVLAGDPQMTINTWNRARAGWLAHRKLDQIETAETVGAHMAAVAGTGANAQNNIRQRIRAILDRPSQVRGFSPEARERMLNVVMGTWASNTARYIGKFAPTGPVSMWATLSAAFAGEAHGGGAEAAMAAAAVAVPTTLAHYFGIYLTRQQIRDISNVLRAQAPGGPGRVPQVDRSMIAPAAAGRAAEEVLANPGPDLQ
jgi:hypothetical protein